MSRFQQGRKAGGGVEITSKKHKIMGSKYNPFDDRWEPFEKKIGTVAAVLMIVGVAGAFLASGVLENQRIEVMKETSVQATMQHNGLQNETTN